MSVAWWKSDIVHTFICCWCVFIFAAKKYTISGSFVFPLFVAEACCDFGDLKGVGVIYWKETLSAGRCSSPLHNTDSILSLLKASSYQCSCRYLCMCVYIFLSCLPFLIGSSRTIRPEHVVRSVYKATGCTDNHNHHVIFLEHVVVRITITHPRRGDLSINLTSPSGTKSQLLANR